MSPIPANVVFRGKDGELEGAPCSQIIRRRNSLSVQGGGAWEGTLRCARSVITMRNVGERGGGVLSPRQLLHLLLSHCDMCIVCGPLSRAVPITCV